MVPLKAWGMEICGQWSILSSSFILVAYTVNLNVFAMSTSDLAKSKIRVANISFQITEQFSNTSIQMLSTISFPPNLLSLTPAHQFSIYSLFSHHLSDVPNPSFLSIYQTTEPSYPERHHPFTHSLHGKPSTNIRLTSPFQTVLKSNILLTSPKL